MRITPNTILTEEIKKDIINTYLEKLSKTIIYKVRKEEDSLIFDIDFNGWYHREKIIDNIYCRIKYKNYSIFQIEGDLCHIELIFNEKYGYKHVKVCNIRINWHNLNKDDAVPQEMKNLLSGVSYKEYRTF